MPLRAEITTVAPATSYDLADLDTVKDELELTDTKHDEFLARQIHWASRHAANYCNRRFVPETVTDRFWPARGAPGIEPLQLSHFPVTSITSVTEDGVALVQDTDFVADLANGELTRFDLEPYPTWWPAEPIVVIYPEGFGTIPEDVVDAVMRLVKMRYFARLRDPMLRSVSIAGVRDVAYWVATGTDAGSVPPDVADLLNSYRVPVIG